MNSEEKNQSQEIIEDLHPVKERKPWPMSWIVILLLLYMLGQLTWIAYK